jgi:hypothetical protein
MAVVSSGSGGRVADGGSAREDVSVPTTGDHIAGDRVVERGNRSSAALFTHEPSALVRLQG